MTNATNRMRPAMALLFAANALALGAVHAPATVATHETCSDYSGGTGWEEASCSFQCPANSSVGVSVWQADDNWVHGRASCQGATAECPTNNAPAKNGACGQVGTSLSRNAGTGDCTGEAYDWGVTDLHLSCWSTLSSHGDEAANTAWAVALALTAPTCFSLETSIALEDMSGVASLTILHAFDHPVSGLEVQAITWNAVGGCVEVPSSCTTTAWNVRTTTCGLRGSVTV